MADKPEIEKEALYREAVVARLGEVTVRLGAAQIPPGIAMDSIEEPGAWSRAMGSLPLRQAGIERTAEEFLAEALEIIAHEVSEMSVSDPEMLADNPGWQSESRPRSSLTREAEAALRRGGGDPEAGASLEQSQKVSSVSRYAALLASSYTVEDAAELLGVSTSRVRQRLSGKRRTLFGVKTERGWRVPRTQFEHEEEVPTLSRVVQELPFDIHPLTFSRWFESPNPALDSLDLAGEREERESSVDSEDAEDAESSEAMSPRRWLLAGGDPGEVVELARGLGQSL